MKQLIDVVLIVLYNNGALWHQGIMKSGIGDTQNVQKDQFLFSFVLLMGYVDDENILYHQTYSLIKTK